MDFAQRVSELQAEGAYQVLARAQELERAGHDVIHLEIGEPDFDTPSGISDAGIAAINAGHTRYTPPRGIVELREALAAVTSTQRGMVITPDQVVVAPGAKPVLFLPTLALVNPGDEVIYPDPGFPTYEAMIRVAGGVPVPVPLVEARNFAFDRAVFDAKISDKTKLIVINSPGNPTGSILSADDLEHIAAAALKYDCWVLSDEIYARIVFDQPAPSIAALPGMQERTVIVDGFSKTYAMTGWRLGFGIMPEALAERMNLMLTHAVGCTAHFTQFAGIAAVAGDQVVVDEMVAAYRQRRDAAVAGLNALPGITCRAPQGAFYAFPNITALGRPADELANLILDEAHVALLPGTAFGAHGAGYLRMTFTNSLENIERALARIGDLLTRLT